MATVKGDVHDIGKNIVGVVLGCNDYEVIDLGVMVPAEKILATAKERNVDLIGLSGLITPSLEEMAHVAREMTRQGITVPLLIGGATTSRAHTSVKIAPHYKAPVVHVLDASRAVGVASSLLSAGQRPEFVKRNGAEQEVLRQQHLQPKDRKPLLAIEEARRRRPEMTWKAGDVAKPAFTGVRVLDDFPLEELVPFIDWSPFFHTWELRGRYPSILEEPRAKELFDDAQQLLRQIVSRKRITARGVYGFFPANSVGDDVEIYTDESRDQVLATFYFLRQQMNKPAGQFNHCLADFIAPKSSGLRDYLGTFAVTSGHGVEGLCEEFVRDHDDYNSIMTKALADRLAEAFAECLHKRAREDWGFGRNEQLSQEELIKERYRGIRPAAGYPACPDHTEKWTLWQVLNAEKSTGIRLTESCAMYPAASVSGLYFAHPESKYFGVGKIQRDQVLDYHLRKGMDLKTIERWLAPNLDYEPEEAEAVGSGPAEESNGMACGCGLPHSLGAKLR